MRIVAIDKEYINRFAAEDREFLLKHGRPCILVVNLRFRGKRRDFAVPFRSNIAPNVPKEQYFALPPRPSTKAKYRHGIHYIKMFPIEKRYQRVFRIEGNRYYETIQATINVHAKELVAACQSYLNRYEEYGRPRFAVDLDKLSKLLDEENEAIRLRQSVALPADSAPQTKSADSGRLAGSLQTKGRHAHGHARDS